MTLVRSLARPMLAAVFVAQGAKAVADPDPLVPAAEPVTERLAPRVRELSRRVLPERLAERVPDDTRTLVRINGAVQVVAGLALATGRAPRFGAVALLASLLPTTLAAPAFWRVDDPHHRGAQRNQLMKNIGLSGGLLLAAVDTDGKPGLRWRARRGVDTARKASRRAARRAAHRPENP